MSENTESMLAGEICASCGDWFHDGEENGVPRYCDDCAPDFPPAPHVDKAPSPQFVTGRKAMDIGITAIEHYLTAQYSVDFKLSNKTRKALRYRLAAAIAVNIKARGL